jgi:hypothetical protein
LIDGRFFIGFVLILESNFLILSPALPAAGLSAHTARALSTSRYPRRSLTHFVWAEIYGLMDYSIFIILFAGKQYKFTRFLFYIKTALYPYTNK